jgi:carboxyl-terminal processing protease
MKIQKTSKYFFTLFVVFTFLILNSLLFVSCNKDKTDVPQSTLDINRFIYENTHYYYLWEENIPQNIQINNYFEPSVLFEDMMFRALDRWSFVTDNYQDVIDALDGSSKMPGYQVQFFMISSSREVFGIVEYVYENSPADNAGIERGDIIIKINGNSLNESNYTDVLFADQMLIGLGELTDGELTDTGESLSITSAYLTINPVLQYSVTDTLGIKVGYLLYDQFIEDFLPELQSAFSFFEAEAIDELVLDFRLNSGGYLSTCLALASILVPSQYQDDVFVNFVWNEQLTIYFIDTEGDDSENLTMSFSDSEIKINTERIFVLTSEKTASASEVIINSLSPYTEIVLIGDTTSGKYTGANILYDPDADHNWGMYLITSKVANADGNTDFINGFAPDYYVEDTYSNNLGDPEEALYSQAIEIITGIKKERSTENKGLFKKLEAQQSKLVFKKGILFQEKNSF